MKHLINDGPTCVYCPYCEELIDHGESILFGGSHLHPACYLKLGSEMHDAERISNEEIVPARDDLPWAAAVARLMHNLYPPEANGLPDGYWDDFKEQLKDGAI